MPSARSHPISAAIVGAGLMGRWHARAADRAGARVACILDPDESRARTLARQFPGCVTAASLELLRGAMAPQVVHICTPTATHDALARTALAGGCHVLVEKPLASDATATEALIRLAREAGLLVCPVHQFVYQRGIREVLASRRGLGEILHVRFQVCSAGAADRPQEDADVIAAEILPHPLSLLERISPGSLDRMTWRAVHPRQGEIGVLGADASLSTTIIVSMGGRPTANEMSVIGTRASAHVDLFHGFATLETGRVSRGRKIRRPFERAATTLASAGANLARRAVARQPAYPGLWELIAAFYAAAAGRGAAPFSPSEIVSTARALDAIRATLPLAQGIARTR